MSLTGVSGAVEVLRLGYILPQHSQLGAGAAVFAAEVARRTGGRFRVEQYPDSMLGGEVAMLKGVQLGTVDLAFITGAPLATVLPDAGVFEIPYLFKNVASARAVLDGPTGDEYLRKFDAKGLVALAWGENGLRQITTSSRPIRTPDDLKGLKLRVPQSDVFADGYKALGADVRQMPFPDVYSALRSGRLDAQENPIGTIVAAHLAEVQTQLSLTGHIYDPALILMSKDSFDALSDNDKAAFRAAAKLAAVASREAATALAQSGLATLRAAGMTVVTDVDKAAFVRAFGATNERFSERFGRDTIARIRSAQDKPPLPARVEVAR